MTLAILFGAGIGWLVCRVTRHYLRVYQAHLSSDSPCLARRWSAGIAGLTFAGFAALWWWLHPSWTQFIPVMVVMAMLAVITLVDLAVRRIPNQMVLALFLWAVVQSLWTGQPSLVGLGLGSLIGGGIFLLIAIVGRGALGMGDVKLAAALGAVLGYPAIISALFAGIIAGGVGALVLILMRRISRKDYIAYGPYLALGAILILVQ